jgi:hypothetical protein
MIKLHNKRLCASIDAEAGAMLPFRKKYDAKKNMAPGKK